MTDAPTLAARADWVQARLDALPKGPFWGSAEAKETRRQYDAALGDLRLGLETATEAAARITSHGELTMVRMLGVQSSSTGGLASALRNWITAARKRAGAQA